MWRRGNLVPGASEAELESTEVELETMKLQFSGAMARDGNRTPAII